MRCKLLFTGKLYRTEHKIGFNEENQEDNTTIR